MNADTLRKMLRKPPSYVAQRAWAEGRAQADRWLAPRRARSFDRAAVLRALGESDIDQLWRALSRRPYLCPTIHINTSEYDRICPGDADRILNTAELGLNHRVNLLGSGLIDLGQVIDWLKDYKSGFGWAPRYHKDIDYNNPGRPSDVKFAWELSRLQWGIPIAQAYLLTREERYAQGVRELFECWIAANPYGCTVNWSCTMEVALRIVTWTWFFHVFADAPSWRDEKFRFQFLRALYLHADFVERNLEKSDVNGNHYTANASGLVFAGLFFGRADVPSRWASLGWHILLQEMPRQVYDDGVDFEMSVAYHRLVLELFLLPALFRIRLGQVVPESFIDGLVNMAKFTASYTRPDSSAPLWGDADDARVLPFGEQDVNDHRYLVGIVGALFAPEMLNLFSGSRTEAFWILGPESERLPDRSSPSTACTSAAFPQGGFYIMRNRRDHVFIDCGPVGLAGRGGHGHNDILAFELVLDGVPLITDCGAYVYTACYEQRNKFRSTAYHNTPMVESEEVNRFVNWDCLWTLHNDARPEVRRWAPSEVADVFEGSHSGYRRLRPPITPARTITLEHETHTLTLSDEFLGGNYRAVIPLHLHPGVTVARVSAQELLLSACGRDFRLVWDGAGEWGCDIGEGEMSPTYGIKFPIVRLAWHSTVPRARALTMSISPVPSKR